MKSPHSALSDNQQQMPDGHLRIVVADYSGHPFQVQLSRELARRGHKVLHLHFAEFQTPKGRLSLQSDDPGTFEVEAISLGHAFAKHDLPRRRREEIAVGKRFRKRIDLFKPDVVLGSNLPLDALAEVIAGCKETSRSFVFWQQDIYSIAIDRILRRKFGFAGGVIGRHYRALEKMVLEASDAIVVISEDFPKALAEEFAVSALPIHVVPNWAPLDEITPRPKLNPWSRQHGLAERPTVLYSGTLGMKHDPSLLLMLAKAFAEKDEAILLVTSEGPAADWLATAGAALSTLKVLPFQKYDDYPNVLGTADVLVSVLESDAGVYSVPSKVLSYLCAGRPIVLSAPKENLASRLVAESHAGAAVTAGDAAGLLNSVRALLHAPADRALCGLRARQYAESAFDISRITDRFEGILAAAVPERHAPSATFRPPATTRPLSGDEANGLLPL